MQTLTGVHIRVVADDGQFVLELQVIQGDSNAVACHAWVNAAPVQSDAVNLVSDRIDKGACADAVAGEAHGGGDTKYFVAAQQVEFDRIAVGVENLGTLGGFNAG